MVLLRMDIHLRRSGRPVRVIEQAEMVREAADCLF
jgi:hypothetical protein